MNHPTPTREDIELKIKNLNTEKWTIAEALNAAVLLPSMLERAEKAEAARDDYAREAVAKWMILNSIPTGHGDTLEDLLGCIAAEAITLMPCGHPRAAHITNVESGETHCSLCDLNAQLNDALKMEREYKSERDALRKERDEARSKVESERAENRILSERVLQEMDAKNAALAQVAALKTTLELYRDAVVIDVLMEGPRFMGANSSALRRAWEYDRAALAATEGGKER